MHTTQRIGHYNACHTKLYTAKARLIALVPVPFLVPLKADLQAPACFSEYHDDDHSLMPAKDARSDGYALETLSFEKC